MAVTPSMMFSSAVVEVTPSRMFSSAVVEVTPSIMLSSVLVAVTPSRMFSSAVVAVTPSRIFNSVAVEVIAVPPIEKAVAFTVPTTSRAVSGSVTPIPTLPVPFGIRTISPLKTEVICFPFTSRFPPN